MGNSWEDPPGRRPPKKQKSRGSSQRPTGTTVGMAWLLLAFPAAVAALVAGYLLHGYGVL